MLGLRAYNGEIGEISSQLLLCNEQISMTSSMRSLLMQDGLVVPTGWVAFGPSPPIFILFRVILLELRFFFKCFMSFKFWCFNPCHRCVWMVPINIWVLWDLPEVSFEFSLPPRLEFGVRPIFRFAWFSPIPSISSILACHASPFHSATPYLLRPLIVDEHKLETM